MTAGTGVVCVDPGTYLDAFAESLRGADAPFSIWTVTAPAALDGTDADCIVVPHVPPGDDTLAPIDGLELLAATQRVTDRPVVLYGPGSLDTDAVSAALDAGAADAIFAPPKRRALLARRIERAAGTGGAFPDAETLLGEILDLLDSDLFIKDDLGRLAAGRSNIAADYGYDREQLVGLTDYELFEQDLADHLWREEQAMLDRPDRSIERIDHWTDDADRDRWHTARKWARTDEDGSTGLVGTSREVTALVRRERLVSQLHRSMRDLLTARSPAAVASAVATFSTRVPFLPPTRLAFVENGSVSVQSPPGGPTIDRERYEPWFRRAATEGEPQYLTIRDGEIERTDSPAKGFDFDAVRGSPTDTNTDIDAAVLPLGDHGAFGLIADEEPVETFTVEIAVVVASNVEAVLDRIERDRALRQRDQRLSVLGRVLRHNLRNDMNSILANLQAIEDRTDDPDIESLAATASETGWGLTAASQQARTIEQILDETGERVEQDLVSLVDTVVRGMPEMVSTARVEIDTPESARVRAIPSLQTAVENVVENAIEHNDSPEPWVAISIRRDGDRVGLLVEDDGPGIPAPEQAVVEGSTATDLEHGTGLGLWLVYWVVDNSGGEVDIETTDDGSRVSLWLPAVVGE